MWDFVGNHYNLVLGIAAVVIWAGATIWFLYLTGFLQEWRDKWRTRHDRQTW